MTRIIGLSTALAAMLLVSACASIVEGTDQTLSMKISPTSAACTVSQKGDVIATLDNGGGQVQVPKSKDDLDIDCAAAGYDRQTMSIESSASGWGIVGCFLIDLCITDYSTGALNKYPKTVTVNLRQQAIAAPAGQPIVTPAQVQGAPPGGYPNAYAPYSAYPNAIPPGDPTSALPQVQGTTSPPYPDTYPPTAYPRATMPQDPNAPPSVYPSAGP